MHIYSYLTQIFTINIYQFLQKTGLHIVPVFIIHISLTNLLVSNLNILVSHMIQIDVNRVYLLLLTIPMPPPYTMLSLGYQREREPPPYTMSSLGYQRERATTTTTRCCLWGTSSLQAESAFTDDSHHFGDRTHVTYSYGLDCEKQEHWNRARNHYTVYLASLR